MISGHREGVVVDVWAVPDSSRECVDGIHDGALRVRVSAPAEAGRANQAIASLVATSVGGGRAEVLGSGRSRRKRVLVRGVTLDEAVRRVTAAGWEPPS